MHYAPARKLIASDVPVALASNFNPISCFTMNMQVILAIACTQMRMTPAEAITAATINSAYSLGMSEKLGTIEENKQADIVLMDVSDYRELPYLLRRQSLRGHNQKGQHRHQSSGTALKSDHEL